MSEIWDQALVSYNLPLTVLLGLVLLFWIVSLLGVMDFDIGPDLDLDADGEAGSGGGSDGTLGFVLRLVNAQDVPLMLVLSLLSLFMWAIAIASNYYFNPDQSETLALLFFAGNFIVSVLAVKWVTQPTRVFFRSLKHETEHQEPLIGSSGQVKSRTIDENFGQCEVIRPKGAPALLNCRLAEGEKPLVRGDKILVIGFDDQSQKFIIKNNPTLENPIE